jgi:3-hydroxybutyryl-CoA dehydrogenase
MGSAIAYLIASKTEAKVTLYDSFPESLKKSQATIEKYCKSSLDKGFLTAEKCEEVKQQISWSGDLDPAWKAELVIEAIVEDASLKQELFKRLDGICKPEAIFASNTSSLPITALASATRRSKQFLGMHFFSPAHIMKLLEIIPGIDTEQATVDRVKKFGLKLGKTIISSKDLPGFITSRLGMVLCNEAAFCLMEGLSTPEEIDTGMTLGFNHPMGPLALADFIGLDILLHILETLHEGFGDPKYRPCPLLKQLVSAGHLGRKSGRGFFVYEGK